MSLLSEEVFSCHNCEYPVVYEPYHTSGIEKCTHCNTKHLIKVQETIIIKYDDSIPEHVNRAKLEIESWPEYKKSIVNNLIKECT